LGITGVPRGPPVNAGAAPVGILRYVRAPHSVCATPRQNRRHRSHDPPSVIARGTVDDRFEHVERGQSLA
jgi:hypothetical protein